jgi:hypothetical protein
MSEHSLTDSSTQRNQSSSPLLRLPPELRIQIYELVLRDTTVKVSRIRYKVSRIRSNIHKPFLSTPPHAPHSAWKTPLSLLGTCRQIAQEATSIAYAECIFNFADIHSYFAHKIEVQRRALIHRIAIRYSDVWDMSEHLWKYPRMKPHNHFLAVREVQIMDGLTLAEGRMAKILERYFGLEAEMEVRVIVTERVSFVADEVDGDDDEL